MNGVYAPHFEVGDHILIIWNEGQYGKSKNYLVVGDRKSVV